MMPLSENEGALMRIYRTAKKALENFEHLHFIHLVAAWLWDKLTSPSTWVSIVIAGASLVWAWMAKEPWPIIFSLGLVVFAVLVRRPQI